MGKIELKKRKICIVTTSRADYGLLFWLMKETQNDKELHLQIIVAAMHLSYEFGLTYKMIEADGFVIDKKIEMLLSSDTESSIIKSIGLGCISFADALNELKPDILVLLGDRYELFSVTIAALITRIPIAHIHGGETSQGAIDEAVRHSITKMATLHFPATETYRKRIIQMGEDPKFVFNYGAPGLDNIYKLNLLNKSELEEFLDFNLNVKVAIVTYHPVTLENNTSEEQIENILTSIKKTNLKAIFTQANADTHGRIINERIKTFCESNNSYYKMFHNLGKIGYLSCLKNLDLMIGNSSSGLIEAPSFGLPVVNIGDRQKGRVKAENVIDVGYSVKDIVMGIEKGLSDKFKESIHSIKNPYDKDMDGKVSYRIKEKLKNIVIQNGFLKKQFYDINLN